MIINSFGAVDEKYEGKCPVCGVEWVVVGSEGRCRKYCSDRCRNKRNVRVGARAKARRKQAHAAHEAAIARCAAEIQSSRTRDEDGSFAYLSAMGDADWNSESSLIREMCARECGKDVA